jgi:hypothetical protein
MERSAPVDGWVSVELLPLLPILTALGAGVLLSAACLLLECRTAGKQNARTEQGKEVIV